MLLELLQSRRSIRQFQERAVEQDKVDKLLEAALRSPSSRSLNPWEFIVVRDKDTLTELSLVKPHGASFLKNAPLAIVVCAHPEKCDVWVEDCSIASMMIHLAAHDLGLGSCWIQLRLRYYDSQLSSSAKARELLGIPHDMEVQTIIAIGYPAEEKSGHGRATLLDERVSYERFGHKG